MFGSGASYGGTSGLGLMVKLGLDSAGFKQGLNDTKKEMDGVGGAFNTIKNTALGFGIAQVGLGMLQSAAGGLGDAIFGVNSQLETSEMQFTTLMGSAEKAKAQVAMLFQVAANTPFETGPIIEASRMLQTFGGDALNTKDNILMVGDAAAAASRGINEVAFWVGRAYSAIQGGQPFGEAASRLQELGILTPQVRQKMEALQKTGASSTEVWGALQENLGKYSGAMEKQAQTFTGLMSTFSDAIQMGLAAALRPLFEGFKDLLRILISLSSDPRVTQLGAMLSQTMGQAFRMFGDGFKAITANGPLVKALLVGIAFVIVNALVGAITAASISIAQFGIALALAIWPITLVVGAIVALYYAYETNFGGMRVIIDGFIADAQRIWTDLQPTISDTIKMFQRLWTDIQPALADLGAALGKLAKVLIDSTIWAFNLMLSLLQDLQGGLMAFQRLLEDASAALMDMAGNILSFFLEPIRAVMDVLASFPNPFQGVAQQVKDELDSVQETLEKWGDRTGPIAAVGKRAGEQWAENFVSGVTLAVSGTQLAVEAGQQAIDALARLRVNGSMYGNDSQFMIEAQKRVYQQGIGIVEALDQMNTTILEHRFAWTVLPTKADYDLQQSQVATATTQFKGLFGKLVDVAVGFQKDWQDVQGHKSGDFMGFLAAKKAAADAAEGSGAGILNSLKGLVGQGRAIVGKLVDAVVKEALTLAPSLKSAFDSQRDTIRSAMHDLQWAVEHPFSNIQQAMYLQGRLGSQGLRDGLRSEDPAVRREAQDRQAYLRQSLVGLVTISDAQGFLASKALHDGLASHDKDTRKRYQNEQYYAEKVLIKGGTIADVQGVLASKALRDGLKSQDHNVRQHWVDIQDYAERKLKKLRDGTGQIGTDTVVNYANGMTAQQAATALVTRLGEIGQQIKDYLHLKSPAKSGPLSQDGGPGAWGGKAARLYAEGWGSVTSILGQQLDTPSPMGAIASVAGTAGNAPSSQRPLTVNISIGNFSGSQDDLANLKRVVSEAIEEKQASPANRQVLRRAVAVKGPSRA